MIIDEMKKANMQALRDKDTIARAALSVGINKLMLAAIEKKAVNQEFTDLDAVIIIQKFVKELIEEAEDYKKVNNLEFYNNILKQKSIIEAYLPQMMSADEIKSIIVSLPDKSIPGVMKYFKLNYNGKCDMRMVNDLAKTL